MTGDDVRAAEFAQAWRGYAPAAVDEALERIARQLDEGQRLDQDALARLQFPSKFRGYNEGDVDDLIDRLRHENC